MNNSIDVDKELLKSFENIKLSEEISDNLIWKKIKELDKVKYENKIKFLLTEYGTKKPCNRFAIGNVIEYIVEDMLKDIGYFVELLPNAKRIDLCINKQYSLSIKYSSTGDITLHNSNSSINKDIKFTDLLLLIPEQLFLITKKNLKEYNIDINLYLENKGDSLKLKRSLLKKLKDINFFYYTDFDLNVDKSKCKNRLTSETFYKLFKKEYEELDK